MSTTAFPLAVSSALAAVNEALDALDTVDHPDSEYVLPLIRAQGEIEKALRSFEVIARAR